MAQQQKKGLGRGLGALLGDEAVRQTDSRYSELRLAEIEPSNKQPRKSFNEAAIAELADSIRLHGVLTPLIVRRTRAGNYQIIAGERRWRAARMAGLSTLPAVITDADDRRASEMALIENLQREDLNALEVAEGYKALMDEFVMTQEEVAVRVGRARSSVANALRLLTLAPSVRTMLVEGKLTEGHARALLSLDHAGQHKAAVQTQIDGMTVRQTESYVRKMLDKSARGEAKAKPKPNYLAEHENKLSDKLGRRVRILPKSKKRGVVELEFYGAEDLDALIAALTD
ncbi:MAG: ParB/RepB/Spo0J family partition protein [Oscillospiraceae bacterium]|jgi:ParB family chromosome partitioning protein|nr:ParB/RepB/Spo0J family partition protein [Oscillospiraceae bacterium]